MRDFPMRHVAVFIVLCLIATTELACSRRTAQALRLPSPQVTRDRRAPRATDEIRTPLDALKNKVHPPSTPAGRDADAGVASQSGDASVSGTGVGTSGALSVETRYPAPHAGASQPPARGRVLTRASDAVKRAGSDASLWVIVLCALAAGLIVALLMRRSRESV